ncbi:MAG: hypothetical protein PVG06_18365 [Desulfobacterales bacterium]|jgi:hypothetical protein
MEKSEFRIFPSERMSADFPWPIWAVGWLCIFKGSIWLAYEPNISNSMLSLLGSKYMLQTVPLIVFGIGIWNLRKWAVWGAVIIAGLNLIFIIVAPQTFSSLVVKSEAAIWSVLLSIVTMLCNGPLGDLLILLSAPVLFRHAKKI